MAKVGSSKTPFAMLVMVTKEIFGQSKDMRRMITDKALLIGFMLLGVVLFSSEARAQCNIKVEYKVSVQAGNSAISLKVIEGTGSIDFHLIDLSSPHNGTISKETRSASTLKNDFEIIFNNVPPGTYIIQAIQSNDCQVTVGGVAGITVSAN